LKGEWKSTGDPTEVALQVFATKLGLGRASLTSDVFEPDEKRGRPALGQIIEEKVRFEDEKSTQKSSLKRFELKVEYPFSSELKRMTTIYYDTEDEEQALVLIKGAVRKSIHMVFHCLMSYSQAGACT